ncbi:hypothetical protein F2Q68_00012507 [Brassica cretica]|uniref:BTB domain-containing protein n=1 Tax=Brassica cretica TaxID=69181 RepID=A0A8S9KT72_BRACR|nr:hypothetical protein F2Q68_00012507 [Brassica cretica]
MPEMHPFKISHTKLTQILCLKPKAVLVTMAITATQNDGVSLSADEISYDLVETDVDIITSGRRRIPAHSGVLASASPVLTNIIEKPRKSRGGRGSSKRVVKILGVPCDAVSVFVRFLYSPRTGYEYQFLIIFRFLGDFLQRKKRRRRHRREQNLYMQLSEAMECIEHICTDGCTWVGPSSNLDNNKSTSQVKTGPCGAFSTCYGLQLLIRHFTVCKKRVDGKGCLRCKRMIQLLRLHSLICDQSESCCVPLCRQFKNRGEKDNKMVEEMKWKVLVRRVASAKAMSSLSQSKKKKSEVLFKEESEDFIRIRMKTGYEYQFLIIFRFLGDFLQRKKRRRRHRREQNLYMQLSEAMECIEHICTDGCTWVGPSSNLDNNKSTSQVKTGPCGAFSTCYGLQLLIRHFTVCKKRVDGKGCLRCKRMIQLLRLHSSICDQSESCRVPLCRQFKNRGEKDNKMVEEMKWKVLVRRVASAKTMSSLSQSKKKKIEVLFKEEAEDFIRIRKKKCFSLPLQFLKPPDVRHSTFESLRLGRSSQSIAFGFLRFWDSQNFKKDKEFVGITVLFLDENVNSVIYGFTPVRRANHYMPSLKEGSIVKVDHFEVARCSSMYTMTGYPFLIHFILLTIIGEVITGAPEINLQSRLECSTIAK